MTRTPDEIVSRVKELQGSLNDFLGFETSDLLGYLPFSAAKPFLKESATESDWTVRPSDRETILKEAEDYMSFAWDKANNGRGISASRSLSHYKAWLWMAGEDDFLHRAHELEDYSHYGKPQLRAICEHFGWDWRRLDDGRWANDSEGEGETADDVADIL